MGSEMCIRDSHSIIVGKNGIAYSLGGGRRGSTGVALKTGWPANKKEERPLIWEQRTSGRFATPVLFGDHLFSVSGGVITTYKAEDGSKASEIRMPSTGSSSSRSRFGRGGRGGSDYASPIVVGKALYVTTKSGKVHVYEAKPKGKRLATNDLSEDSSGFDGTPAASDGELFVRSNAHLYCFAKSEE